MCSSLCPAGLRCLHVYQREVSVGRTVRVISVGGDGVRRGGLGWRKGRRARVEEGEERSSSSIYSLLPLSTLPCSLWNDWGRRREQCDLCD